MSTNGSTLRERLAFQWNLPQPITLEGPGYPQEGKNGEEYRYFLHHPPHSIMWVPPEVHSQIQRHTGSNAEGAELVITRHKTGKNHATWTVERIEDEPIAATAPPPPAPRPPAARPEPTPPAASSQARLPYSESLYTALCASIRVAQEVEKFAQAIGRPLAFSTDDIRAMAATLYIQQAKEARP